MRQSSAPSDVSRYGKYRTAVRSGANAFDLQQHIFWDANGYYFSPQQRVALPLPSLYKLEECWLSCTAGNTRNTGKYSISCNQK